MSLTVLPLRAGDQIEIRVTPSMSFAPADVVIDAVVESNAANRLLRVVAESDSYYRASEVQLDGARAPRTTEIQFRDLPGGQYIVSVTLYGEGGKERASARRLLRVVTGDSC
jgi:hypothetical protein